MFKRFLSLTLLLPMLLVFDGWGQTTIAMQDFDATNSMTYIVSGGTTYTGNSASGDRPASSAFFTSSSTAYGVSNSTATLTFANVSGLGSYTSKYFEFKLASFSISSTGNGADVGDIVTVAISTDGGSTWSNEVRVLGNNNAYWHYSSGTGNATVTWDGDNSPSDYSPTAGGNRTTDGYSTVKVNLPDAGTQARIKITLLNNAAGERWVIDDVKLMGTLLLSPPSLTADTENNNVDNNIDITFTENASWRSAITAVKIGGTALAVTTDYVITAGNLQLKPSGGNTLLRTAGTKAVTVEATGYITASVSQIIGAGAPTAVNSTSSIDASLVLNTTRTVTATAKDQYNNLVSGYTFKYDATITNNNVTTGESYTIDGVGRTSSVSDIDLTTVTNPSGVATFTIAIPATVDDGDGVSVQIQMADGTSNVGSAFSFIKPLTTPTLTADATLNNVDNDIDITFTDSPSWISAITAVKIGGTALTVATDYVISEGNIKLKPSGGNSLLRTAGSKAVTVEATNYDVASVTQQIDAGAMNPTQSLLSVSPSLSEGVTSMLTATAKDQYGNNVSGYVFKYDITVTNNNAATSESYTVNSSAVTSSGTGFSMTATNASGVSQYNIIIPAFVDFNDGISIQVKLNDGSTDFKSPVSFTASLIPSIAISNGTTTVANVLKNTDKVILQQFNIAVTLTSASLSSLTVTTAGTYSTADIKTNGFKLWYNSSNTFTDATQLQSSAAAGPGNIVFSSINQVIASGNTGYFFVTTDINASATAGRTINISSTAFSNIVFTSGYKTGTDPIAAGATKTIIGLDNNTQIKAPAIQVSAGSISSLAVTSGSAVEVFKFDIQEQSSTDGVPTKVTNIKLIPGTGNSAAWSTTIAGVIVKKDGSPVTIGTPTIVDASINIPITSGNLDIANGGTSEISISIYLKSSGIDESKVLAFKVPATGHGFTADATGTGFASTLTLGEFTSSTFTLSVVATKLYFSSIPSTVKPSTNFSVTVKATDDYNNTDLQATNSVTLSRTGGSGTLSAAGGLTKTLSSGSITWSDLQYNTSELFEISATASGLSTGSTSNLQCFAGASDLFISEYVEGTSSNRYIEIFNGTGSTVDLSGYRLRLYSNGSSSPGNDVLLSGTLANNAVKVYKNSSAVLTLPSGVTADNNTAVNFNGNDAIALYKISTSSNVDIFGRIGEDPVTAWTAGSPTVTHSTLDKTLRRKSSVTGGVTSNPGSGFPTLSTEWDQFDQDVATGLGSHSVSYSTTFPGTQTVATGSNTYSFTDKYLRLEFSGVTTGGSIQVAFYGTPPANTSGLLGNVSQYRWVITNNGVAGFTVNFRVKRNSFLGLTTATPGNSDVKLFKRETPGSGSFTELGFMTYDATNDEYYYAVTGFSEFVVQSDAEPLPVELTSFTAKASGTTVTLNWETKTEVDNNGFEVERNATGTWQKIGFVEGHGTANSPKYYSFSDANPLGNKIQYRLKQIDNDGKFEYSPVVEVELAPVNYTLYQNYPNPFNPSTIIRYALPVDGVVTIDVFNALGEKVSTLLNGQVEAGFNQVSFDATNLPSGLYFYRIQSGDFISIKKMLLMK